MRGAAALSAGPGEEERDQVARALNLDDIDERRGRDALAAGNTPDGAVCSAGREDGRGRAAPRGRVLRDARDAARPGRPAFEAARPRPWPGSGRRHGGSKLAASARVSTRAVMVLWMDGPAELVKYATRPGRGDHAWMFDRGTAWCQRTTPRTRSGQRKGLVQERTIDATMALIARAAPRTRPAPRAPM